MGNWRAGSQGAINAPMPANDEEWIADFENEE